MSVDRDLEAFVEAFSARVGTSYGCCGCGREFGADGGDEEFLFVEFEGRLVISECDCWHTRARRIIGFLREHHSEIVRFLNADRARALAEASALPVAKG